MTVPPSADWAEYAATVRRLARLRQAPAVPSPGATPGAPGAAAAIADRLTAQRHQLIGLGVPPGALDPAAEEVAAARAALESGGAPARQATVARTVAAMDGAAAALAGPAPTGGSSPVWLRNLLVYGPFAMIVVVIQIALFAAAGDQAPLRYVLGCGVLMPAVAFGLGWLAVGFVYAGPGRQVDRTPLVGLAVCAAPLLLALVLAAVVALLR
ncbi:hypothetical protein O7623_23290 [Solwaraspora sp. WMMD791]|uniref:hypothetical protein n=1 Tax=Solwaraspora sp. WMMD791 TaxID=3016086 RepID=UPI00249AC122|nr:hypothetical protein [Solwaraspora sp. WMMD791]WFE26244.1 hypothetical protein O7623_23290 [Solwaraspora sp. WMMD791]